MSYVYSLQKDPADRKTPLELLDFGVCTLALILDPDVLTGWMRAVKAVVN